LEGLAANKAWGSAFVFPFFWSNCFREGCRNRFQNIWSFNFLLEFAIVRFFMGGSIQFDQLIILSSRTRFTAVPRPSYITHYWSFNVVDPNLSNMIVDEKATLLESRTMIEQGTTGLKTWPASFALADFLVGSPGSEYSFNTISHSCSPVNRSCRQ
jgi:hypothetical protein